VKHNRHLGDRKMTGKRLAQFYLSQLPENLQLLKMGMETALDKTPGAWEDATAVLDECLTLVTRMHDPTKALPTLPVIGPGGGIMMPVHKKALLSPAVPGSTRSSNGSSPTCSVMGRTLIRRSCSHGRPTARGTAVVPPHIPLS